VNSVGHTPVIWISGTKPKGDYWKEIENKIVEKNADLVYNIEKFLSEGGNYRTAADLWRWHFLYEKGGIWCDSDLFALKHLPSDGIIVVNEFMREYLETKLNADSNKIVIIPSGGESLVDNTDEQKIPKEKKIIYAGLVNSYEHVDLFVKSIPYVYSKHPDSKFIISEKGSDIKNIKNLCKTLPTRPEFYWFKSRRDARNLLKKCYVAILPSTNNVVRKLGTPLKLLEYMSLGIPIVANGIGSWSKLIEDEKIGMLTDDDPQEFANGICTLIEDEKMYRNIQNNMIKLIKEKFNWKTNVEGMLLPFYEKLV
jgi:glycosyltransferase involved in cell wall biosynthesis